MASWVRLFTHTHTIQSIAIAKHKRHLHTQGRMKRMANKHDPLGLTGNWIDVPESASRRDKTPEEIAIGIAHDQTLQQQWNSWSRQNGQNKRSSWPYSRRQEEGNSNQETAEA